ncbi:unnamed protein product [Thelazia callipaeda]|uniref:Sodium channel protein Nach n=1 Tax=Thelazia callipaeda TaxID=103827 RepID=A0A0N5CN24_THECL|nr:unnamed protein product [Thelazia callipaeda]
MRDRYEPVSNFDFPSLVNVDAVGETDDTELITSHSMNNEDDSFRKTITFHDLFHNVQFSHRHRLYIGIVTGTSCTTIMLMIALSFGFGKVLFDTFAQEEKLRHGLKMIPNLWSKPTNVFYFSVRNGTANREYVQEIDDYIAKYMEYQEKIKNYLKNCTVKDRRDEGQWCSFDIRQALGSECSKASNYGYNSGNPCILFAFENYLGWKPNMKSEVDYLPFSCRLVSQYIHFLLLMR